MITYWDFSNSKSTPRAFHDHLDRPSICGFPQPERNQRLIACCSEGTEIRETDSAQNSDQACGETVADHGMPGHRPGHPLARQPRADDDIRSVLPQRLQQTRHLRRTIAVVTVQEHDDVWSIDCGQAGETGATLATPRLMQNPGPHLARNLCGSVG